MKIIYGPLLFQKMKLEFEDTRKRSRTTEQSHAQYDLRMCGHVWVQPHVLNDKDCTGSYLSLEVAHQTVMLK